MPGRSEAGPRLELRVRLVAGTGPSEGLPQGTWPEGQVRPGQEDGATSSPRSSKQVSAGEQAAEGQPFRGRECREAPRRGQAPEETERLCERCAESREPEG